MQELQKYNNQEEARIALSFLHANGIDADLEGTETFSTMPHVGIGATLLKLVVPESQHAEARRLLDDVSLGSSSLETDESFDYGEPEEATNPMPSQRPMLGWVAVAAVGLALLYLFQSN